MTLSLRQAGRKLSKMVIPNISLFIAWGILTTLFHENGWFPNERISVLIEPMIFYAIPMMIAFTGGSMFHEKKGGIVAVVALMGLIASNDVPMFLGAMVIGPFSGYCVKKFETLQVKGIPTGFEMLFTNFSTGILAAVLAVFSLYLVSPVILFINELLADSVSLIVDQGYIFLTAMFIEPAKILFLNNAINHGVLGPLGLRDALSDGKSILFLLETNPGPGLGVLIGYMLYGKKKLRATAPGAAVIHLFGGIHEIYFPYVIMQPLLVIPLIAGGLAGNLIFQTVHVGLTAPPSPGSLVAILALAPKDDILWILIGICFSFLVSVCLSSIILKKKLVADASETSDILVSGSVHMHPIECVYFTCDAGMGSSAMGASIFEKKYPSFTRVEHCSIDDIPKHAQCIITYVDLVPRVKQHYQSALILGIRDFLDANQYDDVYDILKDKYVNTKEQKMNESQKEILLLSNIILDRASVSKEDAIVHAGTLLFESGYVRASYIEGMLLREEKFSTYIGSNTAIPHGDNSVKDAIIASGIVVVQYPQGVDFGDGKVVKLLIGIAGKGNEHIEILANIAEAIEDESILNQMLSTQDKSVIYKLFSQKG